MRNEEARLQAALWQYYQLRRAPNVVGFAVPNGGKRDVVTAVNLRRTGVVPGVSDLIFFRGSFCECGRPCCEPHAVELKSAKGSLTEAQATFLIDAGNAGVRGAVARSFDEGVEYFQASKLVR